MIMSVERIKKAMINVFMYLKGPKFDNTEAGVDYILNRLREKGIEGKGYSYECVDTGSEGLGVFFDYHGWRIYVEEEMFAENHENHRTVYCPPC